MQEYPYRITSCFRFKLEGCVFWIIYYPYRILKNVKDFENHIFFARTYSTCLVYEDK